MKTKFLPILLVSILMIFIIAIFSTVFVSGESNLEYLMNNTYEKCTTGSLAECLFALNEFKQTVNNYCENGDEELCMEGIERYWVTTSKIAKDDGYFSFALTKVYTLTLTNYLNPDTKDLAREAFAFVVPDRFSIVIDLCEDSETGETCDRYIYSTMDQSQNVTDDGIIATHIEFSGKLYDGSGGGPGVMEINNNAGGNNNCQSASIIVKMGPEDAGTEYDTMNLDFHEGSRSYCKLVRYV